MSSTVVSINQVLPPLFFESQQAYQSRFADLARRRAWQSTRAHLNDLRTDDASLEPHRSWMIIPKVHHSHKFWRALLGEMKSSWVKVRVNTAQTRLLGCSIASIMCSWFLKHEHLHYYDDMLKFIFEQGSRRTLLENAHAHTKLNMYLLCVEMSSSSNSQGWLSALTP